MHLTYPYVKSKILRSVTKNYEKLNQIGKGGFAEVFLTKIKENGECFALKCIQKQKGVEERLIEGEREFKIINKGLENVVIFA